MRESRTTHAAESDLRSDDAGASERDHGEQHGEHDRGRRRLLASRVDHRRADHEDRDARHEADGGEDGAPSGGPAVLEGLGILARTDIAKHRNDAQGWYLFSQASRLMYADRNRYFGDPKFVSVPVQGLLDPAYVAERAKLIGANAASPPPEAGHPAGAQVAGIDHTIDPTGTSHIIIRDAAGAAAGIN